MKLHRERAGSAAHTVPAHDPAALPADLAVCLEAITVVPRHFTDDGPRSIVQIDSCGWIHSTEETRAQLLRRWPALSEAQLRRALRHIGARVSQSAARPPPKRRGWVMGWQEADA